MIVKINTHPIVKEVHEEFHMNWCGKIKNTCPKIINDKPIFIIRNSKKRIELNTIDMDLIERIAKKITSPQGRSAVTTDKAYIYLQEENDKETLMGILTHNHIKTYNQMFDKFEYE